MAQNNPVQQEMPKQLEERCTAPHPVKPFLFFLGTVIVVSLVLLVVKMLL